MIPFMFGGFAVAVTIALFALNEVAKLDTRVKLQSGELTALWETVAKLRMDQATHDLLVDLRKQIAAAADGPAAAARNINDSPERREP